MSGLLLRDLGYGGKPAERGLQHRRRGRLRSRDPRSISELGPVIGVGDQSTRRVERFEFPAPEMSRRRLALHSGSPSDTTTLDEVDYVVFPHAAPCESRGEYFAYGSDSLTRSSLFQVVIAVPSRLLRGVGDEFENAPCSSGDLAGSPYDSPRFLLPGHASIQARRWLTYRWTCWQSSRSTRAINRSPRAV